MADYGPSSREIIERNYRQLVMLITWALTIERALGRSAYFYADTKQAEDMIKAAGLKHDS